MPSSRNRRLADYCSLQQLKRPSKARAKELGFKDDIIHKLKEGNISTFGSLAFASPYQIGQVDKAVDALMATLGRGPTGPTVQGSTTVDMEESAEPKDLLPFISQLPLNQVRLTSILPLPNFTRLFCRYVRETLPGFSFAALVVLLQIFIVPPQERLRLNYRWLKQGGEDRLQAAQRITTLAKELESSEREFQATLAGQAKEVLQRKRILLWRKLLDETGFPDSLVTSLIEGVDLVGKPSKSPLYEGSSSHELAHRVDAIGHLEKEIFDAASASGSLQGSSDDQLDDELWTPWRGILWLLEGFPVVQGSPKNPKFPPIDDLKKSQQVSRSKRFCCEYGWGS
ncbi:NAGLU [Symbiodinium sp. CCMP2592]|nr:NAGLU [Symbiodinium sp. CCMP2592]